MLKETEAKVLEQLCHKGHIIWGLSPFIVSLNKANQSKPHKNPQTNNFFHLRGICWSVLPLPEVLVVSLGNTKSLLWHGLQNNLFVYMIQLLLQCVWREWGWWAQVGWQFPSCRKHQEAPAGRGGFSADCWSKWTTEVWMALTTWCLSLLVQLEKLIPPAWGWEVVCSLSLQCAGSH